MSGLRAVPADAAPTRRYWTRTGQLDGSDTRTALWQRFARWFIVGAVIVGFGAMSSYPLATKPVVTYAVIMLAGASVALSPRGTVTKLMMPLPLLLLFTWTIISWTWTINPSYTFLAYRVIFSLVVAATVVASLLPIDETVKWFVRAMQIAVVISVIYLVIDPSSRLTTDSFGVTNAWRAGFGHKNAISSFLAFALPWMLSYSRGSIRAWSSALAVILIIGARSVTGYLGAAAALLSWWWFKKLRTQDTSGRSVLITTTVPTVAVLVLGFTAFYASLTSLVGKDPTLTGRTSIWTAAMDFARARPLTGYGLGGIFQGPLTNETRVLWEIVGHTPTHAHNALLQVQLDLGLVGVVLILALLAMTFVDAARMFTIDPRLAISAISSLSAVVVMSFSEPLLSHAGWLAFIAFIRVLLLRARAQQGGAGSDSIASTASPHVRSGGLGA